MFLSRLSIRWRITIGSLLIAIIFFGVAAVAFSTQVSSILFSTTKTLLEHDAAPFVLQIRNGAQKVDMPGHAQLVEVIDPAGVVQSSTLPPGLSSKLARLMSLDEKPQEISSGDDTYLIVSARVESTDGLWRVISARNLEASRLLQDNLAGALLVGALVMVIGFGVASWLLTGAALKPVTRMRQHASELSRNNSTTGLPVGQAHDELSALATTLNEFIDGQRSTAARERQLVSDASHELRSPLAVLMGQLELAHLSSGDAEALEEQIFAAQQTAQHLSDLATNLLELSEAESRRSVDSSTWSELVAELGDGADRARLAGVASGITVEFDVTGHDGIVRYPLDRWRFRRVLDNLIGNALTAMPDGGQLCLTVIQHEKSMELLVTDSGPGLPNDFLPVAFDRFTRPDASRAQETGGSGLGLAIVRALVRAADGDVTIQNRESVGACVRVYLPVLVSFSE